jgi:hypothetical protein
VKIESSGSEILACAVTEEEGKEGEFTDYVDYGAILAGEKTYEEEEDDEEFQPQAEGEDFDIPEDDDDDAEAGKE